MKKIRRTSDSFYHTPWNSDRLVQFEVQMYFKVSSNEKCRNRSNQKSNQKTIHNFTAICLETVKKHLSILLIQNFILNLNRIAEVISTAENEPSTAPHQGSSSPLVNSATAENVNPHPGGYLTEPTIYIYTYIYYYI